MRVIVFEVHNPVRVRVRNGGEMGVRSPSVFRTTKKKSSGDMEGDELGFWARAEVLRVDIAGEGKSRADTSLARLVPFLP